jgi:hypothetical protein
MSTFLPVFTIKHVAMLKATYLHADYIRTLLPPTITKYAAVPDAGFFLDHANVFGVHHYGEDMRTVSDNCFYDGFCRARVALRIYHYGEGMRAVSVNIFARQLLFGATLM